jgi:diguanylate cyclase (GGDEF)-like protein
MPSVRSGLFSRISTIIEEGIKPDHWLGLLIIDVKDFRTINRVYGFSCGDALLEHIMAELLNLSSSPDLCYHLSDDEFAVLIPNINTPSLTGLAANKIATELNKQFLWKDVDLVVSVNIGASAIDALGTTERLVLSAEHALSTAKKDNLIFHIDDIDTSQGDKSELGLRAEFKQALYENELELFYQPKISLHTEQQFTSEALLRWRHPERGFVPPDTMLPISEKIGLSLELTQWVLNTAFRQLKQWPGKDSPNIAINLSAKVVDSPELLNIVKNSLKIWDMDPGRVTLEVTESAIIEDKKSSFNNLTQLRDLGVKISIDDFGTGYSSLEYFKDIPADELKIDRSFITHIDSDEADRKIVSHIIDLAHSFKMGVVSEGIETAEALEIITSMGCDYGQGYFIAKPIPFPDYIDWWTDWLS